MRAGLRALDQCIGSLHQLPEPVDVRADRTGAEIEDDALLSRHHARVGLPLDGSIFNTPGSLVGQENPGHGSGDPWTGRGRSGHSTPLACVPPQGLEDEDVESLPAQLRSEASFNEGAPAAHETVGQMEHGVFDGLRALGVATQVQMDFMMATYSGLP